MVIGPRLAADGTSPSAIRKAKKAKGDIGCSGGGGAVHVLSNSILGEDSRKHLK